jgi:predicted secreted hydrolase
MTARGHVGTDGRETAVTGEAWFDHEWSTSALGPLAVGWDWFSLQLGDGRELMLFEIRRTDESREGASDGTLVRQDGSTRRLRSADFEVAVLDRWTSPHTRADYPARWRIRVPSEALELEATPLLPDQEMRTSFVYWEGAVSLSGTSRGRPISGQGYVELTGYARSMQGVF